MTSGDFHLDGMRADGPPIAQNPTAEYGKVLSIDLSTGHGHIISMGHRNMQGIVLDPKGRLFTLEHGPRSGDELNLIREGKNYGWPLESYGTTYSRLRIPHSLSFGRHDTYEPPIYSWVPSAATSGLTRIHGFNPAWNGDLLAASLKGQSLFRLRLQGDRVVYAEKIPIGTRIRDVYQHTDGRIVLLTDDYRMIFISPAKKQGGELFVANYISNLSGDMRDRVGEAIETCSQCHSFMAGDNRNAPSLARVYRSNIASTTYSGYSDALRKKGGRWTRKALSAYIADPQRFAPGANMPNPHVSDPKVREAIIDLLADMRDSF